MKNIESIKTSLSAKDYDISNADYELCGFYEWNKPKFFHNHDNTIKEDLFQKEKEKSGIYPDEIWCLDISICLFILPRLKKYRDSVAKNGYCPGKCKSSEDWIQILDKIIYSFKEHLNCNAENNLDKNYQDQIQEGLILFAKYFSSLWI